MEVKMKKNKGKHLTLEDRFTIAEELKQNSTCLLISQIIGKHPTTISKEIKNNITMTKPNTFNEDLDYLMALPLCKRQTRFPFVCNGCPPNKRKTCRKIKHLYEPKKAQLKYERILVESREGINLTAEQLHNLNEFITPLILKGQSIYHIANTNTDKDLGSVRTLYRYVEYNLLTARNIDLPSKVKYKPRKVSQQQRIMVSKKGHLYEDFVRFVEENNVFEYFQFDVVEGKKGESKCLLTILFTTSRLMIIKLLERQTAECVVQVFNYLEARFKSTSDFHDVFEVGLTDNGSEFNDLIGMQYNEETGELRMTVFYCRASTPSDKGALEKNHTLIRRIIPKGTSMEHLTPETVKLIETNINSYSRDSLNGKTPYDVFSYMYGAEVVENLELQVIIGTNVTLSPLLIKQI